MSISETETVWLQEKKDNNCSGKLNPEGSFEKLWNSKCYASRETPAGVLQFFSNIHFREVPPENAVVLEYTIEMDENDDDAVDLYLVT